MQRLIFIFLLITINNLNAGTNADSPKINLTGEILFSGNKSKVSYSSHFGGSFEARERTAYMFTLSGEYNRSRKHALPWISPVVSIGTGYFISESIKSSSSNWFGNINANGNPVTSYSKDTTGFSSIPLIPQLGFNFRPFLRSGRFHNLALTCRAGYQLNIVLDHYSENNKQEDEWIEKYYQEYYSIHTNTTTYMNYKEVHFPKSYLQFGLSNLFVNRNDSRMGYKITYSRNGRYHNGLEFSLLCNLK